MASVSKLTRRKGAGRRGGQDWQHGLMLRKLGGFWLEMVEMKLKYLVHRLRSLLVCMVNGYGFWCIGVGMLSD